MPSEPMLPTFIRQINPRREPIHKRIDAAIRHYFIIIIITCSDNPINAKINVNMASSLYTAKKMTKAALARPVMQ